MQLRPGSRLGPYEVVSSLGSGGMGEVYEARVAGLEPGNQGGSVQITPDGQRFLVIEGGTEPSPITLLLNWRASR